MNKDFFSRNTVDVAKDLIGKTLVVRSKNKVLKGIINETEAYTEDDEAAHSFKGKSKRNEIMFDSPGKCYVYLIYGMYYCVNVVTESKNKGCAVLLRSVITEENSKTDGPGKLCRHFGIDKTFNGLDFLTSKKISIEEGTIPKEIIISKRIGISKGKHLDWNFKGKF